MEIRVKKTVIIILVAVLAVLAAVGTVIGIVVSRRGQNPTVTVTVTFVTNGGKEIAPVTLQKGETLTLPTAEKDGRVFADWYYDGEFAQVCPTEITVEQDETLYARYGAVLTFVTNGGTEIEPRTYFEVAEESKGWSATIFYLLYSLIGKPKLILQIKNKPLTVSLLHFQSRPRGSKLHYILGRIYARIYPLDIGCLSCYNMCSGYIASSLKCYHFRTCEGGKPPFNPPFQRAERLIM